jgi:uncharacterized membrane protein YfcA
MYLYIIYALIGMLAGISMGIIGIGAGVITLPLLLATGMNIKKAVGCILLMQLLPQSLAGVLIYHKDKNIDYTSSLIVIAGSVLGIIIGAYMVSSNMISESFTYKLLTIVLICTSIVFTKKYLLDM